VFLSLADIHTYLPLPVLALRANSPKLEQLFSASCTHLSHAPAVESCPASTSPHSDLCGGVG
jgi:hypothetical protein